MSKRIYVGNLPWSVTKVRLDELFSSFGDIEDSLVITDKQTSRSRGFGFVTFKQDADAEKAIKEMNGKDVEGRKLVVKEAMPLREKQEEKKESREEMKEEVLEEKMPEEKPKAKKRGRKKKEEKVEEEVF